jgi:hypothetical protein
MYAFRRQALVSLNLPSTPIKDLADALSAQAVLRRQGGARDFRVLARIGDDFFVALANLLKRESWLSHSLVLQAIRSWIIAPPSSL